MNNISSRDFNIVSLHTSDDVRKLDEALLYIQRDPADSQ